MFTWESLIGTFFSRKKQQQSVLQKQIAGGEQGVNFPGRGNALAYRIEGYFRRERFNIYPDPAIVHKERGNSATKTPSIAAVKA